MKLTIVTSVVALTLALASPTASADRGGHGKHGRHHGYAKHGYVVPYGRRHHPRRHHHHHHGYNALAGALLLGTIVTTLDHRRPAGVAVRGPAYVVRQPYAVNRNTWYQRDVNGDCFQVELRRGGTQVWTLTHPRYCY